MSTTATFRTTAPTALGALRVGGIVLAVSVIANLLVLAIGRLAGAEMDVVRAGTTEPVEVGAFMVLFMTVLPLALGTLALAIVSRWGERGWQVLAWFGLGLGVLTVFMPFTVQASTGTALTLAAMHLVVGAVWFGAIRQTLGQSSRS